MRRRFFVDQFENGRAVLRDAAAHHLGLVLRGQPGQFYELSDGAEVWLARIERAGSKNVEFTLVERVPERPPRLHATLLLALVKFDRFEWALEKATELGAAEIVPIAAARSEKGLLAAAGKRVARWKKILLEAAQQSRRLRPPVLRLCVKPREAFAAAPAGLRVLLSERPEAAILRAVLEESPRRDKSAALAIGPEGGWTEEEFCAARDAGFREASLGPLILRTETAVVAGLAALNFALGD